ncbi:MAG: tail fiber domain-containing protein [Deltaproteobacteria bacterium]|nr:tail fiber domain-containing protein [Deltaproteobacteria bacterium]
MRISSTGKVGINTSTPAADLEVKESDDANNGNGGIRIVAKANSNHWTMNIDPSNDFVLNYLGVWRAWLSPTAGAWVTSSDRRLKKDISLLPYGLAEILRLNPVTYHMNEQAETDRKNIGFIAQEIEAVIPEMVSTGPNGMKGVAYSDLVPVLTRAIQDLKAENDALKARLDALEKAVLGR